MNSSEYVFINCCREAQQIFRSYLANKNIITWWDTWSNEIEPIMSHIIIENSLCALCCWSRITSYYRFYNTPLNSRGSQLTSKGASRLLKLKKKSIEIHLKTIPLHELWYSVFGKKCFCEWEVSLWILLNTIGLLESKRTPATINILLCTP